MSGKRLATSHSDANETKLCSTPLLQSQQLILEMVAARYYRTKTRMIRPLLLDVNYFRGKGARAGKVPAVSGGN